MATQEDLDKIDQAITDLAAGDRIERVDFSDGHSVQYARVSKNDLEEIRAGVQGRLAPKKPLKLVARKGL